MKNLVCLFFVATICFLVPVQNKVAFAAVLMGADLNDGYAGNVLDEISKRWQVPNDNIQRNVRIQIKIDGKGNILDCITLSSTGTTKIHNSICNAARSIGQYGVPPYAMPADVYLSFKMGLTGAGNTAMNNTSKQVSNNNLINAGGQSSASLGNVNASNPSQKKSNSKIIPAVSQGSSNIAVQKDKPSPNMANEEISYDDWDAFEDSLSVNTPLSAANAQPRNVQSRDIPVANSRPTNIPVASIQIGDTQGQKALVTKPQVGDRSTYTVANRPPISGRLVDGVWVEPNNATNNYATNNYATLAPNQSRLNSEINYDNQSAISPKTGNYGQLASPPKNASSTHLTVPSNNASSRQLSAQQNTLNADTLYAQAVMQKIAPYIRVPDSMNNGKHTVEISIGIGVNGAVGQIDIKKISGTHYIDNSVILAIKNIKDMPIPPNNKPKRLSITFIVEKV